MPATRSFSAPHWFEATLDGRWALVTGAAKRIGAVIASTLHEAGANVAIHYNRSAEEADDVVSHVLRRGHATTLGGHRIRMVVFGSTLDERGSQRFHFIPLGHIGQWLQSHITEHWHVLRQSQTKDPALSFLLTLEKGRRGMARSNAIEPDQDG